MTTDMSVNKIEPLNGNNYSIWKLKVGAVLRSRKLFKIAIEEPEPTRGNAGTEAAKKHDEWEHKNDEAFSVIVLTLSPEQAGQFIGETNAQRVWRELERIHAGNAEDLRIDASLELKNIKMSPRESADDYITRSRNLAKKCTALGQVIPDREIVYYVVRGIHERFETVASVLRPQRSIKLEDVQQALREEETRPNSRGLNYGVKSDEAYRASTKRGTFRQKNTDKKCFVCNKPGHIAKNCWYKQGQRGESSFNQKAGQTRQHTGGKRKEYAGAASGPREERAFAATVRESVDTKIEVWNLDSGCTSHMSPYLNGMTDVRESGNQINVAESDRSIIAEARGNLDLTAVTSNGEEKILRLKDVLYVPELRSNLLSVKKITDEDRTVVFDKTCAKIYDKNNDMIAEAFEDNNLYVLETKRCAENIENCLESKDPEVSMEKCSEKNLWHRRLGHINEEYLDRLEKNQMVRGLKYKHEKMPLCESCVVGKMRQKPFHRVEDDMTTSALELLHIDLCGPMPVESLGGSKYIFVLVDAYSRRIFVLFLRAKHETFEAFLEFKNRREAELGKKILAIRSDNGTEFTNHQFEKLFKTSGIKHQRIVPYAAQSNGVAERANRTLLEGARTLLQEAELPLRFWAETVATVAYVKNCTPTKEGGILTPMQKWNDKIPCVSHLRVFGCEAFYFVPKAKRSKLEAKAKKGIFVGYSTKRAAYRVYDSASEKILEARTVTFNENKKGGRLLQENFSKKESETYLKYLPDSDLVDEETWIEIDPEDVHQREEDSEEEERHEEEEGQNQVPRQPATRGRKPGQTKEASRIFHQQNLEEREAKLLQDGARRSERIKNKNQTAMQTTEPGKNPTSYEEAMNSSFALEWQNAMQDEMDSLENYQVWTLTDRTQNMKVLKSKWIFTERKTPDGTIEKRKARLVVAGFNQRMGIDYEESFTPVLKMDSLRIILSMASQLNLKIKLFDVETAYLNSELKETVYMEIPDGFQIAENRNMVCKLNKSLYGLPQSGYCWNQKLNEILTEIGLKSLEYEPSIYVWREGNKLLLIGVYVDDLMFLGTDEWIIQKFVKLIGKQLNLRDVTERGIFIGIEIHETKEGIGITQTGYVHKVLDKFRMTDCHPVKTPSDCNQDLLKYQESNPVDRKSYQEIMGTLMFLSVATRPDIAYSVYRLTQFNTDPRMIHWTAAKRIIRYLKGTSEYGLNFDRKPGDLCTSTDASWNTARDGKSITGYAVMLGNSLVTWRSKKQGLVALSTCEAELMALCDGVLELKWVVGILAELRLDHYLTLPLTVLTDSKSAIDWVNTSRNSPRTKHIGRRFFFIRDDVKKGNIVLRHVKSEEMPADIFTKALTQAGMENGLRMLGITNGRPFIASHGREEFVAYNQTEMAPGAVLRN